MKRFLIIAVLLLAAVRGECAPAPILEFDGVNDYVAIADAATLDFGLADFSVSVWIKTSASSGAYLGKRDVTVGVVTGFILYLSSSKPGFLVSNAAGNTFVTGTTSVNDDEWHHVVGVRIGSTTHRIYLDGVLEATTSGTARNVDNTVPFYVGSQEGIVSFDGSIFLPCAHNRALSAAEVRGLYVAGGGQNTFGALSVVLPRTVDESLVFQMDAPADSYNTGAEIVEVRDASPSGNHGTLEPSIAAGPVWGADGYVFDGVDDFITANHTGLDWGSGSGTVIGWVRTTYAASSQIVFLRGMRYAGGKRYTLDLNASGKVGLNIDDNTSSVSATSSGSANNGAWHHIAGIRDGNTLRVYIDGVADGTADVSGIGSIDDANNQGTVGAGNSAGGPQGAEVRFDGDIDGVRVYSAALTPTQVLALYNGTAPTNTPVLDMPFTAPSYGIADKSSHRNYGTAMGGVTVGNWSIAP